MVMIPNKTEWDLAFDKGIFAFTIRVVAEPDLRNRLPVGCRPVDITKYPVDLHADFAELERRAPRDDTWTETVCECCGLPVVMGPHQRTTVDLEPERFALLCYPCAACILGPNMKLEHQGGK